MTDHRRNAVVAAAIFYFISVIFLILVLIGNTSDKVGLRDIYFFKIQLANIIPVESPNSKLLNSVARSLGLHDFYQTGLWNFCEGYNDEGIVFCSEPKRFFWFNPVQVLMDELLAGAQIALPTQVYTILDLLRIGQQCMFGLFLVAIILSFILCPITPLVLRSRGWCVPVVALSAITALCAGAATVLATVFSLAAKYALTLQSELNISAEVSPLMLASTWIAALLTTAAFFLHSAVGCCCHAPRKDRRDQGIEGPATSEASMSPPVEVEKKRFSVHSFINKRRGGAHASPAAISSARE